MSTIQVRNINFEPTGNNRITYESSNGYFTLVLGGNRVLDYESGNITFITGGFSINTVTSNVVTTNLTVSNIITANAITSNTVNANIISRTVSTESLSANNLTIAGSRGNSGQVLTSQGPSSAPTWTNLSSGPITNSELRGSTKNLTLSTELLGSGLTRPFLIDLDTDRQLLVFGSRSVHATVYQKSTDTYGTPTLVRASVASPTGSVSFHAARIDSSNVLVTSLLESTTSLQTVVLTVTGTTITVNTPVSTTLAANSTIRNTQSDKLFQLGSSYVLEYADVSPGANVNLRAINVVGTTPNVGSQLTIPGAGTAGTAAGGASFAMTSNVAICIRPGAGSNTVAVPIILSSNNVLTTGTLASININATQGAIIGNYLPTGRIAAFLSPSSGANAHGMIVSLSGTTASISNVDMRVSNQSVARLGSVVVGNNQVIFCGTGVNVLTDNSGTAVTGNNPITASFTGHAYIFGYSANTALIQTTGINNNLVGDFLEVGVSGNEPVALFSHPGYYTQAAGVLSFDTYDTLNNNLGRRMLRTSTGKHIALSGSTSSIYAPVVRSLSNASPYLTYVPESINIPYRNACRANSESEVFFVNYLPSMSNSVEITRIEAI